MAKVKKIDLSAAKICYCEAESVIFEQRKGTWFYNLNFHMNAHIKFDDVKRAVFVNCTFVGNGEDRVYKSVSLWFQNCKKVEFKQCSFCNFNGRVIHVLNCKHISIQDCEFRDCVMRYSDYDNGSAELGGVIYTNDTKTLLNLTSTHFTNCGGCNDTYYRHGSSVISNCTATIHNCSFNNCWHIQDSYNGIRKSSGFLFTYLQEESNNELTDSNRLGPH